jgi:YHS domain-containing protein
MMMNMTRFLAISSGILILAIGVLAGEIPTDSSKANDLSKHQTVCPVMGGKIDSTEYTDIQGQRVYHCCGGCQKKLVANPDKYFKKAAEQGVIFENIQKRCPVSGQVLSNKEIFTDYQGRRIYFSDKDCPAKFAADPVKYLKILDKQTKEDSPEKPAKKGGHEGHMHGM